ncbi:MAG: aryl-sulfate sulfotransferase [Candidatus Kerfeldbacteria bacterium]|nr:aryl-sulfate sulfotransferase [Candidatus Kerfeldbacteria bacterium]
MRLNITALVALVALSLVGCEKENMSSTQTCATIVPLEVISSIANTAVVMASDDDLNITCMADDDTRTAVAVKENSETGTYQYQFSGLLPNTAYSCSAECVKAVEFTTPELPSQLQHAFAPLSNNQDDLPWIAGQYSVATYSGDWFHYYVVVDAQGRVRWYYQATNGGSIQTEYTSDGELQFLVAALTDPDPGDECYIYYQGIPFPCAEGIPGRVSLMGQQTSATLSAEPVCEHDSGFGETHATIATKDSGMITFKTGVVSNEAGEEEYYSVLIVQYAKDGSVVDYWCSEEYLANHGNAQGFYVVENPQPPEDGELDWLDFENDPYHPNSLCDNCEDGHLWISLRSQSEIISLNLDNGLNFADISWIMGGESNQFTWSDPNGSSIVSPLVHQHDVRLDPFDHVTIFNNGWNEDADGVDGHSEALVLDVDVEARTAQVLSLWYPDPETSQPVMGSVDTDINGLRLVDVYKGYPTDSGQMASGWIFVNEDMTQEKGGVLITNQLGQSYQARIMNPGDFGALQ